MRDNNWTTYGPDDGDHVVVTAKPYNMTQEHNYGGTPIVVRARDNYTVGTNAYLTIEGAKQLAQHLRDAVEFLENT